MDKLQLYCNKIVNNIFLTSQNGKHSIFDIENKTHEIINKFKEKYTSLIKNSIVNKMTFSNANKKEDRISIFQSPIMDKSAIKEFISYKNIKNLDTEKFSTLFNLVDVKRVKRKIKILIIKIQIIQAITFIIFIKLIKINQ